MSSLQDIECNQLRNPFIRKSYGPNENVFSSIFPASSPQLKDFKKKILPRLYIEYKKKYNSYSSFSGTVSTIIFYSNFYRQFDSLYLNKDLNQELNKINDLINSTSLDPNNNRKENKSYEIIKLYETLEGSENLYFQKNNEYKTKIRDLLTFLSRDYYGLFREYYTFMYNQTLAKYNAVNQYIQKLSENDSISEKEYKEQYLLLTKVISSEYTQSLPRKKDSANTSDYKKLEKYMTELNRQKDEFKSFINDIKKEEDYYKNVLKTYNEALQTEKEEEKAFIALQKVRTLLQKKIQELGGTLGDKKFTTLETQFKNAYTTYISAVNTRVSKYNTLLKYTTPNNTIDNTSIIKNNRLATPNRFSDNFPLKRFKLS